MELQELDIRELYIFYI